MYKYEHPVYGFGVFALFVISIFIPSLLPTTSHHLSICFLSYGCHPGSTVSLVKLSILSKIWARRCIVYYTFVNRFYLFIFLGFAARLDPRLLIRNSERGVSLDL